MDTAVACRVLGVSRSGYYEWKGRPDSARSARDKELLKLIEQVHADSRGSYGSPRVTAELRLGLGVEVNHKPIERLMRQAGIQGIYRRRGRKDQVHAATEEDLVKRDFTATWPDALWVTDITEHPTSEGKLCCAAVMAVFSRKIIGWSIAARQDTELVINALSMAVTRRQPEKGKTVLHSDHGTQYTAWAFATDSLPLAGGSGGPAAPPPSGRNQPSASVGGDQAELFQLREDVDDSPGLGDSAVDEPEDDDLVVGDGLAGWRKAHVFTLVGPGKGVPADDLSVFFDHVLDRDVQVRVDPVKRGEQFLEDVRPGRLDGGVILHAGVDDLVDQLGDELRITTVGEGVMEALEDGLVD
jgi:helix-turn-helix protein/integrase-like protein